MAKERGEGGERGEDGVRFKMEGVNYCCTLLTQ